MSVTNKPRDGEPIVELIRDTLTGDKYIATRVFARFLDDLATNVNQSDFQAESDPAALARTALTEELLEDNPFTIDSTGWTVDTTALTIDMSRA